MKNLEVMSIALKQKGSDITQLANELGITRQSVYNKINCVTMWNIKEANHITEKYDVGFDYLHLLFTLKKCNKIVAFFTILVYSKYIPSLWEKSSRHGFNIANLMKKVDSFSKGTP